MAVGTDSMLVWDQGARAFRSARVPRRRPSATGSSFTSLRETPCLPDLPLSWLFRGVRCDRHCQTRAWGDRRNEVKEERRAQPGAGDMSGAGHPAPSSR